MLLKFGQVVVEQTVCYLNLGRHVNAAKIMYTLNTNKFKQQLLSCHDVWTNHHHNEIEVPFYLKKVKLSHNRPVQAQRVLGS